MSDTQTIRVFDQPQPVELKHAVKVGQNRWHTTIAGTVFKKERRRYGLHFRRNRDDKVFSDVLVLSHDDGELKTLAMDECFELRKVTDQA